MQLTCSREKKTPIPSNFNLSPFLHRERKRYRKKERKIEREKERERESKDQEI